MRPLEFDWYLPTHGDTTADGLVEAPSASTSLSFCPAIRLSPL
jgi:hypothetical protein